MKYDLSIPLHRKRFAYRCNQMLKKRITCVELSDESNRTINQNRYLHVIIRILAMDTGVTESYAKDVYFKQLANPSIFIVEETDTVTGFKVNYLRSTSTLSKQEMSRAINTFRHWAEEQGYYLPDATPNEETDEMVFANEEQEQMFHQAEMETERMGMYIDG